MQKWEYCTIVGLMRSDERFLTARTAVWFFTPEGIGIREYPLQGAEGAAKKIAELGEQGWEMVGVVTLETDGSDFTHGLYFKRPNA